MESTEELQRLEITALRSIYADDFIEPPPPKSAARLPEFIIRVTHPDTAHANKVNLHLRVKSVFVDFISRMLRTLVLTMM
ncbi:hypothetical protein AX15_005272, partial [Amanita polypyramis BW_CC]